MFETKAKEILYNLTTQEKLDLTTGYDFWNTLEIKEKGVPSICFSDGPHGLRKEQEDDKNVAFKTSRPATAFPPAVSMASTWNIELIKKVGEELGKQTKDQDVDVLLGPGTNIKRSPLCGRNFEYFSEDPYLAGKCARSYIEGVQSQAVGACVKHYATNNQERLRQSISSVVDERALREIYLASFEEAMKAKPYSVMCSYNMTNGVFGSDNAKLLDEILRKEWGFEGFVVTDWNAMNDKVAAIKAKCDIEMPSRGVISTKILKKALKKKKISMYEIDQVVLNIIKWALIVEENRKTKQECSYEKSHDVAREVAEESFVLLKNDENLLPLNAKKKVVVIGEMAENVRYQGAGSSQINPYKVVNFIEKLKEENCEFEYYPIYKGNTDEFDEEELKKALESVDDTKQVLFFVGLPAKYEAEAIDRQNMHMPEVHNKLADAVLEKVPNAIAVLMLGSPVEIPWVSKCKSILNAYLGGEAVGEALYNVIYGNKSPSGKLAETFPIKYEDNIVSKYFPMGPRTVEYRESIFVGYRYYDTAKKDVLFPFGHGLSYTNFEYSNIKVKDFEVSFEIKNVGNVDAYEIAQVYVKPIDSQILRAEKELRGFEKVFIKAGETKKVKIKLNERAFSYYSQEHFQFIPLNGKYEIQVGKSSRDIVLTSEIECKSFQDADKNDIERIDDNYFRLDTAPNISIAAFEKLYGTKMPSNQPLKRGQITPNATLGDIRKTLIGRVIFKTVPTFLKIAIPDADFTTKLMLQQGLTELPLKGLCATTMGIIHENVVKGMCLWANRVRIIGLTLINIGLLQSLHRAIKFKIREKKRKKLQKKESQK